MCPSESHAQLGCPTRERGSALRPAFDVLDADRDGRIGRGDLKAFYSSSSGASDAAANNSNDDEAIGFMITAADTDRDGYVAFEEFEREVLHGGGGAGMMEEVFRMMDRDGDGRVGFADLRGYMDWAGMPATDDDIRAMLRLGGEGERGEGVCYKGLIRILAVDFFSS